MPDPKIKGLRDALTVDELRRVLQFAEDAWEAGASPKLFTEASLDLLNDAMEKVSEALELDLQRREGVL